MRKLNIKSPVRYAILFMVIFLGSCSDWLSVTPTDNLIKEKFWQKTSDVNSALAATYNALRSASMKSLILGEVRADLMQFSSVGFNDYAQIAASNINSTNGAVNWADYYKAINLANTLMFYDKDIVKKDPTFTQEILNAVDAEALFVRSLCYFYLVRIWKDVPLVLEPSISDTTNLYIPKSSEYEVINQIIADLLKAKDMAYTDQFRDEELANVNHYFHGRANKYAIMTLLADVYLWNEQYQKCIDYCDSVTNSGLYDLEPNETWFNIYYPGNSMTEGIFEVQYDDNLESQENPIYNLLIPISGSSQVTPNDKNINLIMDKEDFRRWQGKGPTWKYRGTDVIGAIGRQFSERDANWIVYRYADIMMMKAEASVELNRFDDANNLIRETLLRAGLPYEESQDKELLRKEVLNERGREFLLEGKRWFDILRNAKRNDFANKRIIIDMILSGADIKQQAILRTKVFDTMSYYLPIAEHELLYNQNLVQNPFYNR